MSAVRAEREARWQAMALHRGLKARLLLPMACIYGALIFIRRWFYQQGWFASHKLPVPVLVVGNVVVGGAGKTPTVIALVRHLVSQGWHPGVLSRGHGRSGSNPIAVTAQSDPLQCGDEPALIFRSTRVPVFVSSQRVEAAQALLAAHPETDLLICDDGLQHLALQRDISIAVFDERGLGNGWLLPAGLLREPWPQAATTQGSPDLVLRQYREGTQPTPVPTSSTAQVFDARRRLSNEAVDLKGNTVPLNALKGLPLVAMAGIARPGAFFSMLRAAGLTLEREESLPDHAAASAYIERMSTGPAAYICTEKDAVKLAGLALPEGVRVWSVALQLAPDPAFFQAIDARLKALSDRG